MSSVLQNCARLAGDKKSRAEQTSIIGKQRNCLKRPDGEWKAAEVRPRVSKSKGLLSPALGSRLGMENWRQRIATGMTIGQVIVTAQIGDLRSDNDDDSLLCYCARCSLKEVRRPARRSARCLRAASASSIVTLIKRVGVCGCNWPIRSMSAEITVPTIK